MPIDGINVAETPYKLGIVRNSKPSNFPVTYQLTMKKLLIAAAVLVAPLAGYAGNYSFTDNTDFNSLSHDTAYTWGLSGSTYTSLLSALQTGHQTVKSATLTISGIYDWQVEPADVLYVNILGGLNAGASSYAWASPSSTPETTFGPNPFVSGTSANTLTTGHLAFTAAGANSLLTYGGSYQTAGTPGTWSDPYGSGPSFGGTLANGTAESTAQAFNLVVTFSSANLTSLQTLLMADTNGLTNPNVGLGFGPDCHFYDTGVTLSVTTVPESSDTLVLMGISLLGLACVRRRLAKRSARA